MGNSLVSPYMIKKGNDSSFIHCQFTIYTFQFVQQCFMHLLHENHSIHSDPYSLRIHRKAYLKKGTKYCDWFESIGS